MGLFKGHVSMTTKRALVTGATGFTGGHLCERLASEGYAVRALVRDPSRSAELRGWGVEIAVGDLRDRQSLERAVAGTDVVYHIGGIFRQENIPRREMMAVNAQGTKDMLDAAIKAGVQRFVHCSTIGVHGDVKHPPADEETPYAPGDHYQESKVQGERVALQYMHEGRLPVVVFRPGGIYGPRDLRFLKLIKAIERGWFVMLGSGRVLYQMIYIDDLIDGILLCGQKKQAVGNVYILTGSEPVPLNQFVRMIADVLSVRLSRLRFPVMPVYLAGLLCELICQPMGINPPLYRRRVDFFRKTRSFDISKARKELGFEPRTDLKTGIQLTVDWYRKADLLRQRP
jgi:nucleoside-diphosphate-sugar epimerase